MSETQAPKAVRVNDRQDSHWYFQDGRPCYELPKKDGSGMKNPTLADARKLFLLPSVTTVQKVISKPELEKWKIMQAVQAVLTSPRLEGEGEDAFIDRVLNKEGQHDQERDLAAARGTAMHNAMEALAIGGPVDPELLPWVTPAWAHVSFLGVNYTSEKILIGRGYAGKTDLIMDDPNPEIEWLIDYKTTKKLPEKASWEDHRVQLAAYAQARSLESQRPRIKTANLYISTTECGKYAFFENPPWEADYNMGFLSCLHYWQWKNGYYAVAP
jgi:hypothetical protein